MMKGTSFVSLVAILACLFSTQLFAQDINPTMIIQPEVPSNQADLSGVVKDWFTAKLSRDYTQMRSLMADDFMIFGIQAEPIGADKYVEVWRGYGHANLDQRIGQGMCFAVHIPQSQGEMAGDWVCYSAEARWTSQGMPEVVSWFTTLAKVKDGKVAIAYHFQDNLAWMMQAGFSLVPPTGMPQQGSSSGK